MARKQLGAEGEKRAADFLIARGYQIVARNWRCHVGEADLVAEQGGDLVIIEVRTRRGNAAADLALASINPAKQAKLRQLALAYQALHDLEEMGLRVDIVTVALTSTGAQITLIENALSEE